MRDRLVRILAGLAARGRSEPGAEVLCQVAAEVTAMSGAGLVLFSDRRVQWVSWASDDVSAHLADVELTVGEGPCRDASTGDRPVLEPDLAHPSPRGRWPAYGPSATGAGARAVFGFPVDIGVARLGALGLYRDQPGPLDDDQYADALVMADVSARSILALQAGAEAGTLASELAGEAGFQSVVHQASGMVAEQLGLSVDDAQVRLRAHAYRTGRPVAEVAEDVVDRELSFPASADLWLGHPGGDPGDPPQLS